MSELVDIFNRAAEYVVKGHSQGAFARDHEGDICDPESPNAASWSMLGALARAVHDLSSTYAGNIARVWSDINVILAPKITGDPRKWNDQATKEKVIEILRGCGRRQ